MYSPFKYIKCFIDNSGNKVITWAFNKDLLHSYGMQLFVLYSTTGDTWLILSLDVLDLCYFIDNTMKPNGKIDTGFYRLRLSTEDSLYLSLPCAAGTKLSYPHYPKARNLIRLASKLMSKTGRSGLLLKKKITGLPCPSCKDFLDDASVNLHCSLCLGTGIVGGYYKGIPLDILPESDLQMIAVLPLGLAHNLTVKCRCVAWPFITHGDVWVDSSNNNRYYIDQIGIASSYMHVPLILNLAMHLILKTDVMHQPNANSKANINLPNMDWMLEFKVQCLR